MSSPPPPLYIGSRRATARSQTTRTPSPRGAAGRRSWSRAATSRCARGVEGTDAAATRAFTHWCGSLAHGGCVVWWATP
eukprot:805591-Prymnesium_polylepis.1